MLRKPIAAGRFYPRDPLEIQDIIAGFSRKPATQIAARGVILPHAAYAYSGQPAVAAIQRIQPKKQLIILGPNHTGRGEVFSLWPKGAWQTPLGDITVDESLAEAILNNGSEIKADFSAHLLEHSIEVELPLFKYFFGDFKFIPLACQISTPAAYERAAAQIFTAIKNTKDDVLLVASTDFTHYEPDSTARRKDRLAIEAIINLDEKELIDKIAVSNITMCGEAAVAIFISCLKKLKARKVWVELYQTSGDLTKDYASVVGYAGIVAK